MELDSKKKLFPCPADQSIDAAQFERIFWELVALFRPTLEDFVGEIVRERLSQHMELARVMLQEVDELSREVRERLNIDHRDGAMAEWSKRNGKIDETLG
jgi:hypothetical protein